jgi:hypothetical protein
MLVARNEGCSHTCALFCRVVVSLCSCAANLFECFAVDGASKKVEVIHVRFCICGVLLRCLLEVLVFKGFPVIKYIIYPIKKPLVGLPTSRGLSTSLVVTHHARPFIWGTPPVLIHYPPGRD